MGALAQHCSFKDQQQRYILVTPQALVNQGLCFAVSVRKSGTYEFVKEASAGVIPQQYDPVVHLTAGDGNLSSSTLLETSSRRCFK
jgi:hypothetical protein